MHSVAQVHVHLKGVRGRIACAPATLTVMAKTPNRVIRVPERTWDAYGQVCDAEGVRRTADLIAHMERRINAFIRKGGTIRPPAGNESTHAED